MTSTVFNNMPLAGKLQRLLANAIIICCCVIAISQCLSLALTFQKEFVVTSNRTADIIAKNIEPTLSFIDSDTANMILQTLSADETIESAAVYDKYGSLFASYVTSSSSVSRTNKKIAYGTSTIAQEVHKRILSSNKLLTGTVLGSIYIKFKPSVFYFSVISSIGILLLAFVVAYVSGRYLIFKHIPTITEPIEKLTATATIIAEKKQYDIRIPTGYGDEIGKMTDSFNAMIAQINQRDTELVAIQEDLENQVNLRTHQLAEQTKELKKLNDDLQHFVAIMRHDLRSPMLNLTIYLGDIREKLIELGNLIQNYVKSFDISDLKEMHRIHSDIEYGIDINMKSINTINNIFNAVMDIIAISNIKVNNKWINIAKFVRNELETFSDRTKANNITTIVEPTSILIETDQYILSRILSCLIDNAIKFTAQSEVRNITLHAEEMEEAWVIHVEDTGTGVPEYMKDRLFDLFRRGDYGDPNDSTSTGFGLAYARTLAGRIKASIEWTSAEGKGSVFSVVIRKHE